MGSIRFTSVVVDKFDTFRTSLPPDEANSPRRIYTDAVLPAAISREPLQTVARRNPEVFDILRRMDQFQLPQSYTLHGPIDALDELLVPDAFGILAAERSDHGTSL